VTNARIESLLDRENDCRHPPAVTICKNRDLRAVWLARLSWLTRVPRHRPFLQIEVPATSWSQQTKSSGRNPTTSSGETPLPCGRERINRSQATADLKRRPRQKPACAEFCTGWTSPRSSVFTHRGPDEQFSSQQIQNGKVICSLVKTVSSASLCRRDHARGAIPVISLKSLVAAVAIGKPEPQRCRRKTYELTSRG
jgi:hypothetical protein